MKKLTEWFNDAVETVGLFFQLVLTMIRMLADLATNDEDDHHD